MALRAKAPTKAAKRLKCAFYGFAGKGKTWTAIHFPKPYLIDTERGAENDQYQDILQSRGGVILQENSFDEIVKEVTALMTVEHDYQTLILDPITTVYDDLLEQAEKRVGSEFGRHYSEAKKRWKRLVLLLNRLDMNVIITAHGKKLYGDGMKVLGNTYDGPKGMDHLLDLIIEVDRTTDGHVGTVIKTRIENMPLDAVIPFNYEEIAARYGREILERNAVPVELATPEQVEEMERLFDRHKEGEELMAKTLAKGKASTLAELPLELAERALSYLKGDEDAD